MGDHLELRPPHEGDLTIIEKLTQDPEVTGEFAWFGWHDQLRWRRGWAENRLLGDAGGLLMVVRGDRPLGFVNWRGIRPRPRPQPHTSACIGCR